MIFMRIQKLLYFFFFHRLLKRILGKYHKLHHKKNCLFHFCFLFAPDIREFLEEKERIKKKETKKERKKREKIFGASHLMHSLHVRNLRSLRRHTK
jgi:hypothetical protein